MPPRVFGSDSLSFSLSYGGRKPERAQEENRPQDAQWPPSVPFQEVVNVGAGNFGFSAASCVQNIPHFWSVQCPSPSGPTREGAGGLARAQWTHENGRKVRVSFLLERGMNGSSPDRRASAPSPSLFSWPLGFPSFPAISDLVNGGTRVCGNIRGWVQGYGAGRRI